MELNNPNTDAPYYVVEMVNTFNIDDYWFLHRHQYVYVRSEVRDLEERFIDTFTKAMHHIVYVEETDKFYAIPESIGILTDRIKSEIAQNTILYLEKKYSDNIKDYWKAYKENLPIGETDETFGRAVHAMGWYKEALKRQKGES